MSDAVRCVVYWYLNSSSLFPRPALAFPTAALGLRFRSQSLPQTQARFRKNQQLRVFTTRALSRDRLEHVERSA